MKYNEVLNGFRQCCGNSNSRIYWNEEEKLHIDIGYHGRSQDFEKHNGDFVAHYTLQVRTPEHSEAISVLYTWDFRKLVDIAENYIKGNTEELIKLVQKKLEEVNSYLEDCDKQLEECDENDISARKGYTMSMNSLVEQREVLEYFINRKQYVVAEILKQNQSKEAIKCLAEYYPQKLVSIVEETKSEVK